MDDPVTTFEARRTSFGAGASTYDAVRPPWPEATVAWMLGNPESRRRVIDLGAGTGLGTRTIAALGHQVTGVDPSPAMLQTLRDSVISGPDEVRSHIRAAGGVGERLPIRSCSHEAVTCFQAWHWVDPDLGGAEVARVVRPGGVVSFAWNSWSDTDPWLQELGRIVGTPEMIWNPSDQGDYIPAAEAIGKYGFGRPENIQFSLDHHITVEDLVRLASSWSPVAVNPDRGAILDGVRTLGAEVAGEGAILTFRYVSDCWRAIRE